MINAQFLQNCQAGDQDAIESLVRAHQRPIFQIALSVLDDMPSANAVAPEVLEQAEKATRETFVTAIDRMNRYREDLPFESWLYGIAVDVSRRRYRAFRLRRWLRGLRSSVDSALRARFGTSAPAEWLAGGDGAGKDAPDPRLQPADAALWKAVRGLPEALRLAVVLRYYHEMTVTEIARVLRVSEGAVHARLDAARERIAKEPQPVPENA